MHWLRLLLKHRTIERAMDDEMRHHIACETAEHVRQGMSARDARRTALRDFGNMTRVKEEARESLGFRPLQEAAQDLRYAARILRRNPGFTIAIVLTFALGIGAATAIFSVVYGVLLRPLPYADPGRLVAVWERNVPRSRERNVVAIEAFEAWRDRSESFEGMAALVPRPVTLTGGAAPERLAGAEVSPGYFRLLGVAPAWGRGFTPAEADNGGAAVVILSDGFWKRQFGGNVSAVGRTLMLDGEPHRIVGVMPAGFEPPAFGWLGQQDLWFPFGVSAEKRAWGRFLLVVGRLRTDTTPDRARAEVEAIAAQRATEASSNQGWSATVVPLDQQITGDVRTSLVVLMAAVGLLLLMAVANVAMLTLSLLRRRSEELAIRRAIGATDARLFRQLFTQSSLIGAVGASVGLATAVPLLQMLVALLPPGIPRLGSIRIDAPVLLVTTAAALLATVVFGATAAVRGRPTTLASLTVRDSGRSATARTGGGVLIASEIALAVALTVMAALMARSLISLRAVNLGFSSDRVLSARVALSGERYRADESKRAFFDDLLQRVRSLPGVASAGLVSARPFSGLGPATALSDPAQRSDGTEAPVADIRYADPAYFRTLRIPVTRGGVFDLRGPASGPPQVLISQTAARALWSGKDPLGRRVQMGLFGGITAEVIGVVGDVHLMDARTLPRPAAYLAAARFPSETYDLLVRVEGEAEAIAPALRSAVAAIDPALPVYRLTTMEHVVSTALASDRYTTFVLGSFATAALLLAGVGIFGVFSSDVVRRRKEIGIRIALGARPSSLLLMFLQRAFGRAAAGVVAGAALAWVVARSMTSLLFGVAASDPLTFGAVAATVIGLAGLATAMPVLRAVRLPAVETLREG